MKQNNLELNIREAINKAILNWKNDHKEKNEVIDTL